MDFCKPGLEVYQVTFPIQQSSIAAGTQMQIMIIWLWTGPKLLVLLIFKSAKE